MLSFLPLLLAQSGCLLTVIKKYESPSFREGCAIFLSLSFFAVIALIGQTFHLPSELREYLMLCGLYYDTLQNGETFKFIVRPYDPYDPFRGRYVTLRMEHSPRYNDNKSYALLTHDANGFAKISGWQQEKPVEGAYAKNLILNRYYMNESMAPIAERIQRNLSETDRLYLQVNVKNGNYVIEGLYLNDVRIEKHIAGK